MSDSPGQLAEAVIEVSGRRMRYGSFEAVRGIDLRVMRGEVFAFLGPNGAGKTTTVEILGGHRRRTGGGVSVLGHDPEHAVPAWRARIGVVLQESEPERARVGCHDLPQHPLPGRSRTARRPGGRDRRGNTRRRGNTGLTGWSRPRRGRDPSPCRPEDLPEASTLPWRGATAIECCCAPGLRSSSSGRWSTGPRPPALTSPTRRRPFRRSTCGAAITPD